MTFTILAVTESGEAGFAQATSTPAVGERCTRVVHGHGVLTNQMTGDYRQLRMAQRMMEQDHDPDQVLHEMSKHKYYEYRQIAIINMLGQTAVHTGNEPSPWAGEVVGKDHIATGNTLTGPDVVSAMSEAFMASEGEDLAERLMRALEAGRDAGGQPDGQMSSSIQVYDHIQPVLNLRVDVHPEPIGELRHQYDWYQPLIANYAGFGVDPEKWAWTLDSWYALERHGSPMIPPPSGLWTPEVIEERVKAIAAAPTTNAGKGKAHTDGPTSA
ncbi:DUF1028 domain-containing protein [Streptomyces cellulosae]|uniref:DUF1028 domain-containing protein n=1 Tax=Streptomyces cellulosae TaxID=1968 RepID=UPI0004C5ABEB|nr:DUF1028 domain-containing protein [Streptomyces cellulosae]